MDVARALVAELNISTGIAHDSGPIAALKTRLKSHVMATKARLALWLFVPAGKTAMMHVPMTNVRPESAFAMMSGHRRPSLST